MEPPKEVIEFAVWYSGMLEEVVIRAYKRYLKEKDAKESNIDEFHWQKPKMKH